MRSILSALAFAFLFVSSGQARQNNPPEIVQQPEGGRLDAVDDEGNVIGPCPLKHTDVDVEVAGHFTRVTLRQEYHNPYDAKIEAVYTFPMSHRAAVDRMRMVIGERIVDGEVKERDEAREIYEAARAAGHVASLLEQERPNIFTQSVANIEPGAKILVEISYIETLEAKDGEYTFDFPMVVGPRYIPGSSMVSPALVPAELEVRRGVILLGPAKLEVGEQGIVKDLGTLQTGKLSALLTAAVPIKRPGESFWGKDEEGSAKWPEHWYSFTAKYADGSQEQGQLYVDGTGHLNNRWFFTDPKVIREMGTGFSQDTNQVPDASRITPEPVKPGERAGHDVSVSVSIDTGGPVITELESDLHEIEIEQENLGARVDLALAKKSTIPNRDFVLRWRLERDALEEAILTHAKDDGEDNFITLILNPPDRVEDADVRPRELIFVMDTSGSMSGFPIEKSKQVMRKAIDSMREGDTFNLITFAGHTEILWDVPRLASERNKNEALRLVDQQRGSGGTEMMKAIDAALVQTDKGERAHMRIVMFLTDGYVGNDMAIVDAIRKNAGTTRVFSFGIGNSVNRFLLDGMAEAGRGEAEFVLLDSDADETVERFARRIQTPVLTDISLTFSDNLDIGDVTPGANVGEIPDLFDVKPLVIHARYAEARKGTLTIRGRTGAGAFERTIDIELPETNAGNDQLPALWARAKIDSVLSDHLADVQHGTLDASLKAQVVDLGVTYSIMSQYTSFVAVEKSRVTIGGEPMLVPVPIEMPQGVSYEGIFGDDGQAFEDGRGNIVMGLQPRVPDGSPADLRGFDRAPREESERLVRAMQSTVGDASGALPPAARGTVALQGRGRMNSAAIPGGGGGGGGFGGGAPAGSPARPAAEPAQVVRYRVSHDEGDADAESASAAGRAASVAEYITSIVESNKDMHPRDILEAIFGDADQKLFIERLSLTIIDFVQNDQVEAAATLAKLAKDWKPENAVAIALAEILVSSRGDPSDESVKEETAKIAADSRKTIEAYLEAPMREIKMRHRLEDVLEPFAFGKGFPEDLVQMYDGPVPTDSIWQDGGIVISILFDELDDADIDALQSLGVKIIQRGDASSNFVFAVSPLGRFDDIAMLEGVRAVRLVKAG